MTVKQKKRVVDSDDSEDEEESDHSSASSEEEASRRSRSKRAAPKGRESSPAAKKAPKRVSLSDDDFDGLESQSTANSKAKKKRPAEEPALNAAYAKQVRRTADEAVKPVDFVKTKKKPSNFPPPAAQQSSKQFQSYRIPKKGANVNGERGIREIHFMSACRCGNFCRFVLHSSPRR